MRNIISKSFNKISFVKILVAAFTLSSFFIFNSGVALAASAGPNNAGTGADVAGVGTVTWSGPGNITTVGTPYATASLGNSATSHYLQASNYGFSIPSGATINGIQVSIRRQSSLNSGGHSINDNVVRLVKGGTITGDNKATTTDWPTSMATTSYGATNDLWGSTWTTSDINASNFGVVLSAKNQSSYSSRTASVDYMQITVTYTAPTTGSLTVTKNTIGGDGTFDLSGDNGIGAFQITTTANTGSHTFNNLTPDSYTITETVPSGWEKTSDTCTAVTVSVGETATCAITNTKLPTLTVTKVVVNHIVGTKQVADFPLFINGTPVTSGVPATAVIGQNTVTETGSADYTATFSGDCDSSGHITLAAGENNSCTLTNEYIYGDNLIKNPSFEQGTQSSPLYWQQSAWSTNEDLTANFEYPVEGTAGQASKAARVTITNYGIDGDAKWYFDEVSVTPGQYYAFSDKYKSTIPSKVTVQYNFGGTYEWEDIGAVGAAADWQTFEGGFIPPAGVVSATIFHLIDSVGTLTVDDYSLIAMDNPYAFDQGMVSLTFDDGWKSIYNNAIQILNTAGFDSTQYIYTGAVLGGYEDYMSPEDVRTMYAAGHDIAAHSRDHISLNNPPLTPAQMENQVDGSRYDLLTSPFGLPPVDSFDYPYGNNDATVQQAIREAGFLGARTVDSGLNDKSTNRYALKVLAVKRGGIDPSEPQPVPPTTLAEIQAAIDTAAANRTWLILVFHQIDNNEANVYGTTPEMLQDVINYLLGSGVSVKTVSQGLQLMPSVPATGDPVAPLIVAHENVIVEATSSAGAVVTYTAPAVTDNLDTGLGAYCLPASGLLFPLGDTTITCTAADSSGNLATPVTFTVTVQDTTKPVITLIGDNPQTIEVGSPYTELGANASDNYDGDITSSIVINSSSVNTAIINDYTVTYNVTDSHGNAAIEVTRTVHVVDTTKPVITLLGAAEVNSEVHNDYTDAGATALDNYDGDITSNIVTVNPVNKDVVADYTVTYNVTDSHGNTAVEVTRTVHVVDTTKPVITLIGDNPQTIEAGSSYIELGATVTDNYDTGLSATIDASAVNTSIINSYPVTYDAVDAAGNHADQVIRTVIVQDTINPVVSVTTPVSPTNAPSITFTVTDATIVTTECKVNDESFVVCTSPFTPTLTDGTYTVTVQATDAAGNIGSAVTDEFTADTTGPTVTITNKPAAFINIADLSIEFTVDSSAINIECKLDAAEFAAYTSPVALSGLAEGSHTFIVKATDELGNTGTDSATFTVDLTKPVLTVNSLTTNDTTPSITGTTDDNTTDVSVTVNEKNYTATPVAGIWSVTIPDEDALVDNTYIVSASQTDVAGNTSDIATGSLVINTAAPNLTVNTIAPNSTSISGTTDVEEPAIVVTVNINGTDYPATVEVDGTWSLTLGVLAEAEYPVSVIATDGLGNYATVSDTLIIDTTSPVITLNGENPQVIEVGSAYTELGATATDNVDTSVTVNIDHSAVNTALLGTYQVTYNADDRAGNHAIQETRTVNVVDTTKPVITLLGDNPVSVEVGSIYTDAGATASDNYDGDLTGSIVTSNSVNKDVVGDYTVTYDVSDAQGNVADQVIRTVHVTTDATPPVITLNGDVTINLTVGDSFINPGATATDNIDGDITINIVVSGDTVNTSTAGTYLINYDVSDSAGNPAIQKIRTVIVELPAPVITAETAASVTINSITITWTTDHPATSRVIYDTVSHPSLGAAPNYGYTNSTIEDLTLVTSHSVVVSGLTSSTTYFLRTVSHGSPESVSTELVKVTSPVNTGGGGGIAYVPPTKKPGDIDGDGKVDILDFNLLMINWGSTTANNIADLNADRKVDILDFNLLMVNWGK